MIDFQVLEFVHGEQEARGFVATLTSSTQIPLTNGEGENGWVQAVTSPKFFYSLFEPQQRWLEFSPIPPHQASFISLRRLHTKLKTFKKVAVTETKSYSMFYGQQHPLDPQYLWCICKRKVELESPVCDHRWACQCEDGRRLTRSRQGGKEGLKEGETHLGENPSSTSHAPSAT